jgi:uncharacterized membrane protein HdeD (DUF308 family)
MPGTPNSLLDRWWVLVVRGLLVITFGVLAAILPQVTMVVLLMLFAAFVLLDGIVSLASAIGSRDRGWQLFGGLLSVAIGILIVLWPVSAGFALIILIAAWAITRGAFDIAAALALQGEIASRFEWLLLVSGVASILFGFFVALWPLLGAVAIVGLIAAFAIFLGITLVAAGLRQRSLRRHYLGPPAGQTL